MGAAAGSQGQANSAGTKGSEMDVAKPDTLGGVPMKPRLFCAGRTTTGMSPGIFRLLKLALPLAMVAAALFGYVLASQSGVIREFQAALSLSVEWLLLVCLSVWCATFIFLTFRRKDLPLTGLLVYAVAMYFINHRASLPVSDAIILLAGVTLGRGVRFLLQSGQRPAETGAFLLGLTGLLAFASWWHLPVAHDFYPGTRWTGLWNNPNLYGMLMGAGVGLASGLLAQNLNAGKWKTESENSKANAGGSFLRGGHLCAAQDCFRDARGLARRVFLFIATGMMAAGLLFSCSRGAWLAMTFGLLYLAWGYGKFKWQRVWPGVLAVAVVVGLCWHATADTSPWYLKRLDFSRPSAQHRVAAWLGALQMMRDHPLGVGWNQAVSTYEKNYSPPAGGATALTTNSYLMLGTELGWPGLLCFAAYVWLGFKNTLIPISAPDAVHAGLKITPPIQPHSSLQVACRSGALVLLVAFWFDGGLFDLPTAVVFWILLELGAVGQSEKPESGKAGTAEGLTADAGTTEKKLLSQTTMPLA